jgi:Molybdopterin oxidoreductase
MLNLVLFCGAQGVNGGGWAHYVGQEKVRPLTGWTTVAFALDWVRPPRQQAATPYWYLASDYGTAASGMAARSRSSSAGLADTRDLETVSRMCGDVDIEVAGRSCNTTGELTRTFSHRRVPAFAPGQVRTLRRWHGLLFYEELRPIETALPGWWELGRYRRRVEEAVRTHSRLRRGDAAA